MIELVSKRYKIISELGKGGMAKIYLANDSYDRKLVAIKILDIDKAMNKIHIKRFHNEVQLITKVNSPYVVKVIDYKLDPKINYIVMEYIKGVTLHQKIKQRINFNSNEVVKYTIDILKGLKAIHDAKIVHRDIKSLNIMITNANEIKIIDFGISLASASEHLTKTNNIIASVNYVAPEIIKNKPASESSDIYAVGILMYEMLTGKYPYNSKDQMTVANNHLYKPMPSILKYNNNVRQSVINIVRKAMAKKTSDRYANTQEMIDDLSIALSDKKLHEKPIVLPSEKKSINWHNYLTNQWFWVGLLSFIIVLVLIIEGLILAGI